MQLTAEENHRLSIIPLLKRNDSTYVLELLRILYRKDLNKLNTRTATGQTKIKEGIKMSPLTPEKKYYIVKKLEKRISYAGIKRTEKFERIAYERINYLINKAIQNIRASKQNK